MRMRHFQGMIAICLGISSTSTLARCDFLYYKNGMTETKTISVLIERDEEWWIAQCVEHDLATQARTLDDLHQEIQRMLIAHVAACEEEGIEPFQIPPAPPEVRERFERAKFAVVARGVRPVNTSQTRYKLPVAESRITA